jgi:ATP-dependent RNA helicase DDX46/PRP5
VRFQQPVVLLVVRDEGFNTNGHNPHTSSSHNNSKFLLQATGLRAVCVYGGAGVGDQIADLKRGAEVVVCTPGRMIDILSLNGGRITNLKRATFLVLDEADRMFDMGFEPQITRIIENIRPNRQTVMFSATFPRQIETAARKILQQPLEIVVGGKSMVCKDVEQHVEVLSEEMKFRRLLELLSVWYDQGNVLVFVDRQDEADKLYQQLIGANYPCLSLHSGKDQMDRDSTIEDFKNKVRTILIATSVAARGLDVKDLKLVVNFDVPSHFEDYVHRVGRTGRAGNKGTSYTFLTPDESIRTSRTTYSRSFEEDGRRCEYQEKSRTRSKKHQRWLWRPRLQI